MQNLNNKQRQAINDIISRKYKFYALTGAGGTGKSFTVKSIPNNLRVAYTAPTNKAVSVLRGDDCQNPYDYMTIYSLMGLKVNEYNGKTTIDKKNKCKAGNYDIIIIDEASMIDKDMCEKIKSMSLSHVNLNIVLMGDEYQLPPVGESSSTAFDMAEHGTFLTEQMRQEGNNHPMIPLLSSIRESIDNKSKIQFDLFKGKIIDKKGHTNSVITTNNDDQFKKWIEYSFLEDKRNYYNIIVAYTNDTVDRYNNLIHYKKNIGCLTPFTIGDTLVVQSPIELTSIVNIKNIKENVVYKIDDKITIKSISEGSSSFDIGGSLFIVDYIDVEDINNGNIIRCLKNRNKFNNWIKMMGRNMDSHNKNNPESYYKWPMLYAIRNLFADVRLGYAITIHKSQGSTYDNVFIDMKDIEIMNRMGKSQKEVNKCLYVAASRAKLNVIALSR
jgi:hypothetical protein